MQGTLSRHDWKLIRIATAVAAAAVMVALGVLVTFKAWTDIFFFAWNDEEASQVWLVFPVAAWLIFVRRGRFRGCQLTGTLLGPVVVAVGCMLSIVGFYHSIQACLHLGAVLVPVGGLLTVIGRDLIRRFLPAFLVLVFLVPIPGRVRQAISNPMMRATATVTQQVSDALGVPVDRLGNQLCINDQPVNIVEACNGLRMVFSLLLVSYAFAFGEPLRQYVRLIILIASPLSAIVCNVIRLVPTLWMHGYGADVVGFLASIFGKRFSQLIGLLQPEEKLLDAGRRLANNFHDVAGWVMLVVGFLLLMAIIRILRWALLPVRHYTLATE